MRSRCAASGTRGPRSMSVSLRRLMRVRLNVRVDESQGGSRGLQHAPASHPFVRPLQLFGRDGEWIDDHDPALAQVIDAELADLRIGALMIVDEIMQVGALVRPNAANRFSHRAIESGVG